MDCVPSTSAVRNDVDFIETRIREKYPAPPQETKEQRKKRLARLNAALYRYRKHARTSGAVNKSVQETATASTTTAAPEHGPSQANTIQLDLESQPPIVAPSAKKRRLNRNRVTVQRGFSPISETMGNSAQPDSTAGTSEARDTSTQTAAFEPPPRQPDLLQYNPGDLRLRRETEAARQRRLIQRYGSSTLRVGLGYHEQYNWPERHRLGPQRNCTYCNAPKWPGEAPTVCCNSGQVVLPPFDQPPPELRELFNNATFIKDIRKYNNAFAFTSMGASVRANDPVRQDQTVVGGGVFNYRIQGALCHRIGSLAHLPGQAPSFAQLYFYDSSNADQNNAMLETRMSFCAGLDRSIMSTLQRVLTENNPLAGVFKHAYERMSAGAGQNMQICLHSKIEGIDQRRYNRPTVAEVGGLFLEGQTMPVRELMVHTRTSGQLVRIFEQHAERDALQYPLLHPYAEVSWTIGLPKKRRRTAVQHDGQPTDPETSSRQITPREHAAYRLCWRPTDNTLFHRAGRLFQQLCVDMFCKVEAQRLLFQRNHQQQLRAELYQGVWDIVAGDQSVPSVDRQQPTVVHGDSAPPAPPIPDNTNSSRRRTLDSTGTRVILAPSFVGCDRYMRAQYQDAMAIVRALGKPDLFITITCNPKWPEITENLLPGQHASDRPDLTARVFHAKKNAILNDLRKGALGVEVAHVYVIEFQKRGLPHTHLLLILGDDDKPQTPDDYDKFVSAEIPDPANVQLYQTVTQCMMHGPCGSQNPHSPCMKEGICTKHFPKPFCDHTHASENGYPAYRRRDTGRTVTVKGIQLDNRHVVPYNPWLSHKYDCHINVEVCTSITGVKYLYKYIFKGNDRAAVFIGQTVDEIQMYQDMRYISPSESCWRIMRFEVQEKTHVVVTLPIHLMNQQNVLFRPDEPIAEVLSRGKDTKLTCFFELAAHDDFAKTLLYHEVPTYYRFGKPTVAQRQPWHSAGGNQWLRRTRNEKMIIGRMVYVPMTDMERYCLPLLLCYRKGPTSFLDLRTVRGTVCATYQQAAVMEDLLEDDNVWDRTLREAISFQMPRQLRNCFVMILTAGQPQNPRLLWDTFVDHFCEDFRRQHQGRYTANETDDHNRLLRDVEHFRALSEIDRFLRSATPPKDLSCYPSMPQLAEYAHIPSYLIDDGTNALIKAERQYSVTDLDFTLATVHLLNEDQRRVYDMLKEAVESENIEGNRLFFLDGPGGTGKSYLLEKILAYTRRQGKIALATASSGIAALLLSGGKTVHSTFKLPLDLDDRSTCAIPVQSKLAELIRETALIVWDEASMASRYALEAVDRTFQDIIGVRRPFGGKVVLLSGDFRQILPIVPKGTGTQIIEQCIKRSILWQHFTKLQLRLNMRVRSASDTSHASDLQQFADFLLKIGEGRHETFPGLDSSLAKVPIDMVLPRTNHLSHDLCTLITNVYSGLERYYRDPNYFSDRSILSPLNADVTTINNVVLDRLHEPLMEYRSVDTLVNPEEQENLQLPPEYLNSLNISGIPVHRLRLKRFVPVLLLRNLNTDMGLCNGTRLQIIDMKANCIHARILTGKRRGDDVLLPRIYCDSSDKGLPFQIRRKQFPIQPCFAMTINKSQGQSLNHVGLYLPRNVFAHGQLYVALSRVTSRSKISILIYNPEGQDDQGVATKNIVYKEVIDR